MLIAIAAILALMWLFGIGAGYTLGGLIHVLLALAVVVLLVRIIHGGGPVFPTRHHNQSLRDSK